MGYVKTQSCTGFFYLGISTAIHLYTWSEPKRFWSIFQNLILAAPDACGSSPAPNPEPPKGVCKNKAWKGDSYCDDENNNSGCEFDGGDCCGPTVKKNWCKACKCLDPKFNKPTTTTTTPKPTPKPKPCGNASYKGD